MTFASQNEEKLYKKWLKDSPFNQISQATFHHQIPNDNDLLNLFRKDKELIKAKNFIPFTEFYGDTFVTFLSNKLTEDQQNILNALMWRYIAPKIESMNKLLKQAYDLLDNDKKDDALAIIKKLADVGHPEACYLIAAFSMQGQLLPKKAEVILEYAQKAMQFVNHPRSNLIIAGLYYEGFGVERDIRKAVSYILDAERNADADPFVYSILAEYYQDGYIVNRDVEKAAVYAYKAEGA